jgi:hypothetical protein
MSFTYEKANHQDPYDVTCRLFIFGNEMKRGWVFVTLWKGARRCDGCVKANSVNGHYWGDSKIRLHSNVDCGLSLIFTKGFPVNEPKCLTTLFL